jgi:hypothetical protein
VASGVECKLLCPIAQKSNAAPVSDSHEKLKIQSQRLGAGENPATAPVRISELDVVRSAGKDFAEFLIFK